MRLKFLKAKREDRKEGAKSRKGNKKRRHCEEERRGNLIGHRCLI